MVGSIIVVAIAAAVVAFTQMRRTFRVLNEDEAKVRAQVAIIVAQMEVFP